MEVKEQGKLRPLLAEEEEKRYTPNTASEKYIYTDVIPQMVVTTGFCFGCEYHKQAHLRHQFFHEVICREKKKGASPGMTNMARDRPFVVYVHNNK